MKFTVRMTRRELITVESLLHAAGETDAEMFAAIADGFNSEIAGTGIRRLKPLSAAEGARLAARLARIEERGA